MTAVRWIALLTIVVLLVGGGIAGAAAKRAENTWEAQIDKAHDQANDSEREAEELDDERAALEKKIEATTSGGKGALSRRAKLVSAVRKQSGRQSKLARKAEELQVKVDALVVVPDIAGDEEYDAESAVEDKGLTWVRKEIEGTCTDYHDHFENRNLGWSSVVKQSPSPGTKVLDGAEVTAYFWNYTSGWELDCNDI